MMLRKRALLGATFLLISACQTMTPVPSGMYHDQQKYLTYRDDKAMVGAIDVAGGYTYGWAWGHSNIDSAIKQATEGCEKNRNTYEIRAACKVHFIGNQNVRSLSDADLKNAISNYKVTGKAIPSDQSSEKNVIEKALTDKELCKLILSETGERWDPLPALSHKIEIAMTRGLTPASCTNILG
ncbi:hypothetical protein O4H49_10550 [Kiloniella laminariae]|uniref:DUF4189 domain-containing protein n=1 Tax=Kiloniella laminariae TaxID=454162 RepID=A0ABT4LJE2_9PROT|nr:hypothetical protein [Kiloniella laminariae]MCZ4281218.1 hypothetical protein [Kiloniella laminariae]